MTPSKAVSLVVVLGRCVCLAVPRAVARLGQRGCRLSFYCSLHAIRCALCTVGFRLIQLRQPRSLSSPPDCTLLSPISFCTTGQGMQRSFSVRVRALPHDLSDAQHTPLLLLPYKRQADSQGPCALHA